MASVGGKCRVVRVVAFRGDRTPVYRNRIEDKMDDEDNLRGSGPTNSEILLYAGHAGVSLDGGATIWRFNPMQGSRTTRQLLYHLKRGQAVTAQVRDDTAVFSAAARHGLNIQDFDVLIPRGHYNDIENALARERNRSNYTYGFPNGDGECNCITWIERIGVPLITGRMEEFEVLAQFSVQHLHYQRRRFGVCVP